MLIDKNTSTTLSQLPGVGVRCSVTVRIAGQPASLPGGGSRTWTWTQGRLTGLAQHIDGQHSAVTLADDAAGRLTQQDADGVSTTYAYDPAGQLVEAATTGGPARAYSYDPLGRRATASVDGIATLYAYDAAGQLIATVTGGATTTLTYDQAGRRLGETGPDRDIAYSYDARGRLATVTTSGAVTVAERGWDPQDRLTSVTVTTGGGAPQTTSLWWHPLPVPQPARIHQPASPAPLDLVYGHGRVYALDATGGAAVFAVDHHGSQIVTAATAALTAARAYSPFGQPDGGDPHPGTVAFGYRGELHSGALLHLRQRDYQPATGAFLTVDPLDGQPGYPTHTNGYHYAHNHPFGYQDPLGLRPWSDQDARCWVLFGSCAEVAGDVGQAARGAFDALVDMGSASAQAVHDPLSVAQGFRDTYTEAGGGWWGAYAAANLLNPLYHLLTTADACLQANRGSINPRAAARACTEFTVTTAATTTGARGLAARHATTAPTPPSRPPHQTANTAPQTAGNVPAGTPVGRSGLSGELNVASRNSPATIGGREYTGHALDRMQGRGFVPSVVEDAIAHGQRVPSRGGTSIFYSADNNISVVLSSDGRVVTVGYGRLKP